MQYTISYILDYIYNSKNEYDCFDDFGFYTNGFTENTDEIEMIEYNHNFFTYLDAIIDLDIIKDEIYHCYYHKETKNMKMIISSGINSNILNVIYNAWQEYSHIECDVYIYSTYCNELYLLDNYETDKKEYYKYIAKRYINMIN